MGSWSQCGRRQSPLGVTKPAAAATDTERERLQFEMRKYEEEKGERALIRKLTAEREAAADKLRLEELAERSEQRKLAEKREAAEAAERERQQKKEADREAADKAERELQRQKQEAREAAAAKREAEEKAEREQQRQKQEAREAADKAERETREAADKAEREQQRLKQEAREAADKAEREQLRKEKLARAVAREAAETIRAAAREAADQVERDAQREAEAERLKLQQDLLAYQKAKDKKEAETRSSVAAQLKFYGEIVKNLAPRFPADHADLPMFFESIEKIFVSVKAPEEIQAKLLLPHLSDRAKSLLLRLDSTRQNDYVEVRQFLLNVFQLTPFQFKNRFENAKRQGDETWTLYCARLKNLLEYYYRSRKVDNKFENLFSLIVADRVKSVLPISCLNFILSTESSDPTLPISCDKIAQMADTYFATHLQDGKPRTSFSGNDANAGKSFGKPTTSVAETVPDSSRVTPGDRRPANVFRGPMVGPTRPILTSNLNRIRCFQCHDFGHTRQMCPQRRGPGDATGRNTVTSARVQACALQSLKRDDAVAAKVRADAPIESFTPADEMHDGGAAATDRSAGVLLAIAPDRADSPGQGAEGGDGSTGEATAPRGRRARGCLSHVSDDRDAAITDRYSI